MFLHKLIESYNRQLKTDPGLSKIYDGQGLDFLVKRNFQQFYLGDLSTQFDAADKILKDPTLRLKIPYPLTLYMYSTSDDGENDNIKMDVCAFVEECSKDIFIISTAIKLRNNPEFKEWKILLHYGIVGEQSDERVGVEYRRILDHKGIEFPKDINIKTSLDNPHSMRRLEETTGENGITGSIAMVRDVFEYAKYIKEIMKCNNIYVDVVEAPGKLNKKRLKTKQIPISSYRVLKIKTDPKLVLKNSLGGTHATPKFHFRRGHIRRLPSGKTTWVNSAVVGDIKKGRINKTYTLSN